MRGLSPKLQTRDTAAIAFVHLGRQLSQLAHLFSNMAAKDTDVAVLHLGTNGALKAVTDGQCVLNADSALQNINIEHVHLRTRPDIPILVCVVPPTTLQSGQRHVAMLNSLLQCRCTQSRHIHYVETNLSTGDLSKDGVTPHNCGKKLNWSRSLCQLHGISSGPKFPETVKLRTPGSDWEYYKSFNGQFQLNSSYVKKWNAVLGRPWFQGRGFKMACLNINRIMGQLDKVGLNLNEHSLDIFGVCKTF